MKNVIKYKSKEAAIQAVKKDGTELRWCSTKLQDNEEVVMEAIKRNYCSFYFASSKLRSNKDFVLKAFNEGVEPCGLFQYTQGEANLDKELAAKALVSWGTKWGSDDFVLWQILSLPLKSFFLKDSCYEQAQAYLYQLEENSKQAEMVAGGSTAEDAVVW